MYISIYVNSFINAITGGDGIYIYKFIYFTYFLCEQTENHNDLIRWS